MPKQRNNEQSEAFRPQVRMSLLLEPLTRPEATQYDSVVINSSGELHRLVGGGSLFPRIRIILVRLGCAGVARAGDVMAVGSRVAVLVVAALSLAGCGGGGGGSSGPGGGGTGGPTPTAAKPGNALMLHAAGTSSTGAAFDGNSPQYGSTVNIASSGGWTVIPTGSTVPADLPADVYYDYKHTPAGVNIYSRPVTVTVSGGTGGLTGRSVTGTEYVACATTPGPTAAGIKNSTWHPGRLRTQS